MHMGRLHRQALVITGNPYDGKLAVIWACFQAIYVTDANVVAQRTGGPQSGLLLTSGREDHHFPKICDLGALT